MAADGIYRADDNKVRLVSRRLKHTDIMREVMNEDRKLDSDTIEMGQFSRSRSGLRDIYNAVRDNVQYRTDPSGKQIIKSPEYTIQNRNCNVSSRDKYCGADCKSFSLLIASQLRKICVQYYYAKVKEKGAPGNLYHMYPIAILDGDEIPMDATPAGTFGVELPYQSRQLYKHSPLKSDMIGMRKEASTGSPSIVDSIINISMVAIGLYGLKKLLS